MKSGNLNFLEPSPTLQASNGTALPFYLYTDRQTDGTQHNIASRHTARLAAQSEVAALTALPVPTQTHLAFQRLQTFLSLHERNELSESEAATFCIWEKTSERPA